jgi:phosphate transport system permease protein
MDCSTFAAAAGFAEENMNVQTRKVLDRSFTALGLVAVGLMTSALFVILLPIFYRGAAAFCFRGTVEFRRLIHEQYGRGDNATVEAEIQACRKARQPVYDRIAAFEKEVDGMPAADRRRYRAALKEFKEALRALLGPMPGDPPAMLVRDQYGQTRWDRAGVKLERVLFQEQWDYSDPTRMGVKQLVPRENAFKGTTLEPAFPYIAAQARDMLRPRWTFYWRFLTDVSLDSHMFGGIWPEVLGTIYLTLGAMLFAVPMGVVAAIYLVEYAGQGRLITMLRICISTLAGVPSIVFGLFGLAFFINTLHVSHGKSVLAGSMTLALLVLPTVIRASEEALRAVPKSYKEAALSLGAGKWRAVTSVILPAALPGILTGIVISMGRAAGETAPIIFTAAVSVGAPVTLIGALSQPTLALPWNIFNLATEHVAVDEIRHVQFGMVLVLVAIVLLLNLAAILLRARVMRKLRG